MSARSACNTERRRALAAAGLVAGSFALAFTLSLCFPALFRGWNDRVTDRFFLLRYRFQGVAKTDPALIHVVVDDSTYDTMGLPSRDRDIFVQTLALLQESEVRLVVCDVLFKDPGVPLQDRRIVAAARHPPEIVWPVVLYPAVPGRGLPLLEERFLLHPRVRKPGHPPTAGRLVAPFAALQQAARGFGHINTSPEPGGLIRRLPLLYSTGDGFIPALALKAVLEYLRIQDVEVRFGKSLVLRHVRTEGDTRGDLSIPIDEEGKVLINYTGPGAGAFQTFPVHKLLAAWQDSETRFHLLDLLEGALVVLSDNSTVNKDFGPGRFQDVYPLSSLHVTVINSILTDCTLSEQGRIGEIFTSMLCALALGLAAARFQTARFSLACALLCAGFLLFALGLFTLGRIVPSVAAPCLGFAFALLSVNTYGLLWSEREQSAYRTRLAAAHRALADNKRELAIAGEHLLQRTQPPSVPVSVEPEHNPGLRSLKHPEAFAEIVTINAQMLLELKHIESIAENGHPILITGESGVGKELTARAIHALSRREGKFVSENIAGLDDTMVTDTLFGHARGAYTDAGTVRKGLVEEAGGGTLFLDEIGDISIGSQVKLLRFIEEKEYRPLGIDEVRFADARIIIATNVDLEKRLAEGKFRQDLYFRLTHRIHIPPLRERMDDLPLLIDHFGEQTAKASGTRQPVVPAELLTILGSYAFPGNIRELKNLIENAWSRGRNRSLSLPYIREYVGSNSSKKLIQEVQFVFAGKFPTLKEVEQAAVAEALKRALGNQNLAARLLGLSASALSRRLNHTRRKEHA